MLTRRKKILAPIIQISDKIMATKLLLLRQFRNFYSFYAPVKQMPARLCQLEKHLRSYFFFGPLVAVSLSNHTLENQEESNVPTFSPGLSRMQIACRNSVNNIDEFLKLFTESFLTSGCQYKSSLNKLITLLREYENLLSLSISTEETEIAIVAARAEIVEHRKEFLEFVTIMESIEKLASAASRVSFLMSMESSALSISITIDNVKEMMRSVLSETKEIENQLLKIEQELIQNESKP